jgi:hypothetical protein
MVGFEDHGFQLVVRDGSVVRLVGSLAAADWTGWDATDSEVSDRMAV